MLHSHKVDHTLLRPDARTEDYKQLCEEAIKYKTASVCVPPYRIRHCVRMLGNKIPVCTVIGFPNGYNHRKAKLFETELALEHGATEIDMVINLGYLKDGDREFIEDELEAIRRVTKGYTLKVIIETGLLTDVEKRIMCEIVGKSGADYIKTSTGFNGSGATPEDVILLRKYSPPHIKVKASGGIDSLKTAESFIELGADRLGTSKIVKLVQNIGNDSEY